MANKIILEKNGVEQETDSEIISGLKVIFISGDDNTVKISYPYTISNSLIHINGNRNIIELGSNCHIINTIIQLGTAADDRRVTFGNNCNIYSLTADIPYTKDILTVGSRCTFKSNCHIRCEDGHVIFDINTGEVLNYGGSVNIGDHVFVGSGVFIGKNSVLSSNTIVLPHSNITKKFEKPDVILGGNPARTVRENIAF